MDMKRMMMEAQKMQKELLKIQEDLSKTVYDGESSMVKVKVNGDSEVLSVKFDLDDDFEKDDIEMLEDSLSLLLVVVLISGKSFKLYCRPLLRLLTYSNFFCSQTSSFKAITFTLWPIISSSRRSNKDKLLLTPSTIEAYLPDKIA